MKNKRSENIKAMKFTSKNTKLDTIFNEIIKDIIDNKDNDAFYHKLEFNTKQLINLKNEKGEYIYPNSTGELITMFNSLNNIKENHCLYWFELEDTVKAEEVNKLLNAYRNKKLKKVPATNKNENSKILYVGVRQKGFVKRSGLTNIVGRLNQHLGYYPNKNTQGLQLYHYLKDKDYKITIKVIEFEGLDKHYLNIIEKKIAEQLKPLCGRH